MKKLVLIGVLCLTIGGLYVVLQKPSTTRNWSPDQALPATATVVGDEVAIKNVRNFTYRSTTDYTPGYYDVNLKLSDLATVDYIVEPFGNIGAAHTFLSFGFTTGEQIAISVEIRKEVGEGFSPWKGLLRQYELTYVIADERDVINLRANHRRHNVYLYPTSATSIEAQALFVSMLERANTLTTTPEFYNTIFNNCTTNIVRHINKLRDNPISFDYRMILPEHSDVLAKELGFIASDLSIEEARVKFRINERAGLYKDDELFSKRIRQVSVSQ